MRDPTPLRRLATGGGLILTGNVASALMGLVLLLMLARALDPAELAIVMGVIAIVDGGQMFLDATVNTGMIHLSAKSGRPGRPAPGMLRAGWWTKLALGLAFAAAIALAAPWLSRVLAGDGSITGLIRLAGAAGAAAGAGSFVLAVLTAEEAFGRIALVSLVKNAARLGLVSTGLWGLGGGAEAASVAVCLAALVSLTVAAPTISWRFLAVPGRLLEPMRRLIGVNGWLMLSALAMLGGRLDVWLVGWLASAGEAGIYAVAAQLCMGVGIATQALVTTLLPSVSRFDRPEQIARFLRRSAGAALPLLALPLLAWPLAGPVLGAAFGADYAGSAEIFVLLFAASITSLVSAPLFLAVLSVGEARLVAWGSLLQLALRVGLALAVVPALGGIGLAAADIASRVMAMALIGTFILRALRPRASAKPNHA